MAELTDSIRTIKGVGAKAEEAFHAIGVETLGDLRHYYPREYDSFEKPVLCGEVRVGVKNTVRGFVIRKPSVKTFGGNSITVLQLEDETGKLQVNWFHMPYLRNTLKVGQNYIFRGLVTEKKGRVILQHPELFSEEAYRELQGKMLPIYALSAGLTNNLLRKSQRQVAELVQDETDFLPVDMKSTYRLMDLNEAVGRIHFPNSVDELTDARRRLAFDEFLLFMLGIRFLKGSNDLQENHFPMQKVWKTEEVIENLPYKLTDAQYRVWGEVENDIKSTRLMRRLIQGDVGSGKTILAFLAMIQSYENGYQSALMVPTEVLARQHYAALLELLEKNDITDAEPVLLTGSVTAAERREAYRKIADGSASMIIGTHALIQEAVTYHDLGLVITDEQHRFGVRQRENLASRGFPPNVLVMSATPIPRTLALMMYGDLDISLLDSKPANRLPIKNCVVNTDYRETAYRFISKEVDAGHQIYIICPMVEPNEEMTCENVVEYTKKIKNHFGDKYQIASLHGQMKAADKQTIMDAFANGEIQILVSTTVIEVGVNVPNATVMMVENAERFGLAQLHQLRGRVGRGDAQSYCIFIQGDGNQEIKERLEILNRSNDGFHIAEEDLKLRGPGDLFGERQSGIAVFRIGDIYRDQAIMREAYKAVNELMQWDPGLMAVENEPLKEALMRYISRQNDNNQT